MRKLAPNIATFPNGSPIAVARPSNPTLAVSMAKEAVGMVDEDLFDRIEKACGPYVFVGYLSNQTRGGDSTAQRSDGKRVTTSLNLIVDYEGKEIGPCKPGDSFVEVTEDAPFVEAEPISDAS
jgi:hypothetical protein